MIRKSAIETTTLLLLLLAVPLSWAQERAIRPLETNNKQALVIGNANYAHAGVLRNPANDARAIGKTLQQLGFKVTTLTDADERQMDQAIRKFGRQLRSSNGVGLFYYAGHGMQIDGENYLLPTDINPSNETDVSYDAVPVGKLLGQMKDAGNGMNVVILDACRNNPFARSFRSSSRGLAQVVAPAGTFISYATAPGDVAADGEGNNGLFTEKLLQHITTPGLRLEEVFKRVRAGVQQDSNNKQVPWDSSSVTGDFFFVPMEGTTLAAPVASGARTTSEQDFATKTWEIIKDSKDPALLESFTTMFPKAPQVNLAKLKLMELVPRNQNTAYSEIQKNNITDEVFKDSDLSEPPQPLKLQRRPGARKLFRRGMSAFIRGDYPQAVDLFDGFLEEFQDDVDSDNAYYWIGYSQFKLSKWDAAESAFRKVLQNYEHRPTSQGFKTPDAIYMLGKLAETRKQPDRAAYYFKNVLENYPGSVAANDAQEALRTLR